jgi:hypothetical protein
MAFGSEKPRDFNASEEVREFLAAAKRSWEENMELNVGPSAY